ncbi:uncharacterized protein [Misgurnus anguillicaudatus]|uniref:uncharacterized protein isoform X2 n=1 Tax=Misgurnus anguillicaudatus TaxID=75329 RepID=UPI003CCFD64A
MDALLHFIETVFPNPTTSKLAIEGLNSLGVETIDDLQFLKDDDLGGFLRPIEARKRIAQIPNIASNLQNTANDLCAAEYTSDASGSPAPGCSISPSSSSSGRQDTCVPSDICSEKLPATPCIVVCGENPLTASVYMAAVDQMIVNDHLLSFTEALYLMFSLYYILNISYPVELGATLEFLQR